MSSEKVVQAFLGVSEMSSRARFQFSVFLGSSTLVFRENQMLSDVGGVVSWTLPVAEVAEAGNAQQLWLLEDAGKRVQDSGEEHLKGKKKKKVTLEWLG